MAEGEYPSLAVARVKVSIHVERPCQGTAFTGWLVKKLLGVDSGDPFFNSSWKIKPRRARVTGLFLSSGDSVGEFIHVNYCMGLQDHDYEFLIATTRGEEFIDRIITRALNDTGQVAFSKGLFNIILAEVVPVEIEKSYMRRVDETVEKLLNGHEARIVFNSPAILADPISVYHPATTAPTPLSIFSVPVRTLVSMERKGKRDYVRGLLALHRSLAVTPEYLRTVRLTSVTCRPGVEVFGIIGYLRLKPLEPIEANRELVRDALLLSEVLGVGLAGEGGLGWVTFKAD